jgi:hypothetical protein
MRHDTHFFFAGFPARKVRTEAEPRFSFLCVLGGAAVTMSIPWAGLAGLGTPGGHIGGGGIAPAGTAPPGRRPGGGTPARPLGSGGIGIFPPGGGGLARGGDLSIGHMVIVILQSGSTTFSQTEGRMISPLGPIKS